MTLPRETEASPKSDRPRPASSLARLGATTILLVSPVFGFPFPIGPLAAAGLLGPTVWPGTRRSRAVVVGAVTWASMMTGLALIFIFLFGLCGPDLGPRYGKITLMSAFGVYIAGEAIFVPRRLWAWPVVSAAATMTLAGFLLAARLTNETVC